jgi:hypothetical protein
LSGGHGLRHPGSGTPALLRRLVQVIDGQIFSRPGQEGMGLLAVILDSYGVELLRDVRLRQFSVSLKDCEIKPT